MGITAMEMLERCRRAPGDLLKLNAQLARLRECAEGLRGQDAAKVGSAGTTEQDRLAAFSAEIDEMERKIQRRKKEKLEEERVTCLLIAGIPAVMGEVLYRYYVCCLKLAVIAQQNSYHPSYVRKLKAQGDEKIMRVESSVVEGMLPGWYKENTP